MGMGLNSFLSKYLLAALKVQGITFLYQVRNTIMSAPLSTYWIDATKLGFIDDLASEWEAYISALSGTGIQLNEIKDELSWSGGDGSGTPSARNLYKALLESMWSHNISGWCYKLWKWKLALKLKLFFWLLL
jgi:hypothetical protein